ncbi:hypothetical protein NDU88_001698 [Pleurodeles waltl]|uniref:Uncharacterized protein n=1 Tax=Pleurodeles waltl TaxID=8319 RepID=A0AAV7V8I4_PLEWA|nr:hypothetical protein NDU88_001698 [Pleurodeles waltl]
MPGASPAPVALRAAPGQIRQAVTVEGHRFGPPPRAAYERQFNKLVRVGVGKAAGEPTLGSARFSLA